MDREQINEIYYRNEAVKRVVVSEAKNHYYDSVDLIVMDFMANCINQYGDDGFSLYVISPDKNFHKLDRNFVVMGRFFRVSTKSWDEIDELVQFKHPDASILMSFSQVYMKNLDTWLRYINANENLKDNMFDLHKINVWVSRHFVEILRLYDKILNTYDFRDSFQHLASIITRCEYIIFMLNSKILPNKLEDIQTGIRELRILPYNFLESYDNVVQSRTLNDIRLHSLELIIKLKNLLDDLTIPYQFSIKEREDYTPKIRVPLTDHALSGTCELIYAKWLRDMEKAESEGNRYLSFMTMAKCQRFYNYMYEKYDIPIINLIADYNPEDLRWNTRMFRLELLKWQKFYIRIGKKPDNFSSVYELEKLFRIEPVNREKKN